MSSPPASFTTSPLSPSTARHPRSRSRFTYKHLQALHSSSPTCPLRVIAHIDLDAFYAQCEMVRLALPREQPLAVQQWGGLIAINYAARAFGLSRHVTVQEAREKCPAIICQHVATWRAGDEHWAYHEDAAANMATHKVSLDPYRLQSRRILGVIAHTLPAGPLQRVEKASVDEVFLDLCAHVHSVLLQRFPELGAPPPYNDPSERLPAPPSSVLDWGAADALVDLDAAETEEDAPDWDDVVMQLGAEIVRGVRAAVFEQLGYTCSAGVARNKMLAKLGSAHKKPNSQTIVRNRAVSHFLSGFKMTKIRNLGGKLGENVVSFFGSDSIADLLEVSQDAFVKRLGAETGAWLYSTLRGDDASEVTPRVAIKSMLSAKSFRPPLTTLDAANRWLRVFASDIAARLDELASEPAEDAVTDDPEALKQKSKPKRSRRPRSLNLHHRQGGAVRSRQAPIPPGPGTPDREVLLRVARELFASVVADGRAWPCANLSLSVGAFEDGPASGQGIGGFLVKGEEARALMPNAGAAVKSVETGMAGKGDEAEREKERPSKRRRVEDTKRINAFFTSASADSTAAPGFSNGNGNAGSNAHDSFEDIPSAQGDAPLAPLVPHLSACEENDVHGANEDDLEEDGELYGDNDDSEPVGAHGHEHNANAVDAHAPRRPLHFAPAPPTAPDAAHPAPSKQANAPAKAPGPPDETTPCPKCAHPIPASLLAEHQDWHLAAQLQEAEEAAQKAREDAERRIRERERAIEDGALNGSGKAGGARGGRSAGRGRGRGRARGGGNGGDRGQMRLAFGNGSGSGERKGK